MAKKDKVPAKRLNLDAMAKKINERYYGQLVGQLQGAIDIGNLLIEVKDGVGHGEFGEWANENFEFGSTQRAKFMGIARFASIAATKHKVDILQFRVAVEVISILANSKTPVEARRDLLKMLRDGRQLQIAEAKDVVKKYKPSKKKKGKDKDKDGEEDSNKRDDGRIQCLDCEEWFELGEFADQKNPVLCNSCNDRSNRELEEEDAAKRVAELAELKQERELAEHRKAEAGSVLESAWVEADSDDKQLLIDQFLNENAEVCVDNPETKEPSPEPYEEVLFWWEKCDQDEQFKILKKVGAKKILDDASPKSGSKPKRSKGFVRPSVEEVAAYVSEKEYDIDPEAFIAHYESNGWKVGKNPMKSWRSACTTWQKMREKDLAEKNGGTSPEDGRFRS